MKRFVTLLLCLAVLCSCAFGVMAAPTDPTGDPTEVNTGPASGRAFFIFVLILAAAGSVYLFFRFRK